MLDQVNEIFGIVPDHDLDVFAHGQTLNGLMAKVFDRLDPVLVDVAPDAVVVQGDTSTVAAASIAAFYRRIPVVHIEAGLRSGDINSPFPEEANRKLTSQIAALHLAPTVDVASTTSCARRSTPRPSRSPATPSSTPCCTRSSRTSPSPTSACSRPSAPGGRSSS